MKFLNVRIVIPIVFFLIAIYAWAISPLLINSGLILMFFSVVLFLIMLHEEREIFRKISDIHNAFIENKNIVLNNEIINTSKGWNYKRVKKEISKKDYIISNDRSYDVMELILKKCKIINNYK